MRFTLIDEDNIMFFEPAIGDYYSKKSGSEIFAGIIDDEGTAAAAGVFVEKDESLNIRMIAVDEEHQRQGMGSLLLDGIKYHAKQIGVRSLDTLFFTEAEDEGADAFRAFLLKNGFTVEALDAGRSVYDLHEVMKPDAFSPGPIKYPYRIRSVFSLSPKETEAIKKLDDPMIDPEEILSEDNRYGSAIFSKDELCALLYAEPFADGVRIGSLYGNGDGAILFPYLFEHAKKIIAQDSISCGGLYIDHAGEQMLHLEEFFLKRAGVAPLSRLNALGAVFML